MRRNQYPPVEPFNSGWLKVAGGHSLYYEECGNAKGQPALFLHGGPGSGCEENSRRFFDPRHYRIVLFDQRGSGRSLPHASLLHNTTWDLVADIEILRAHLGIDRWLLFGGSWGSALALAYAERHVEHVLALVLRGVFLLREEELKWFYQEGAHAIFPDAWGDFVRPIPIGERADLLRAYNRLFAGPDGEKQLVAARAWSVWEMVTSTLVPDPEKLVRVRSDDFCLAFARIECHFFVHGGFFQPEDQLIRDIGVIRHVPAVIVQGRHDVVCPMLTAWELHQAWPEAEFRIVHDAGHSSYEPGIVNELITATDRFRQVLP